MPASGIQTSVPMVSKMARRARGAGAAFFVVMTVFCPYRAIGAEEAQCMSRAHIKHLIATANKPADYQKLATYFHDREDFYRAKAQAEMTESAHCIRNVMMTPKFPTRAGQTARLYEYYSAKADKEARLAARYDGLSVQSGVKPVGKRYTVPVTSFRDAGTSQ
jgi:hypothetical protein